MATPLRRGGLDARSAPPPSNPGAPAPFIACPWCAGAHRMGDLSLEHLTQRAGVICGPTPLGKSYDFEDTNRTIERNRNHIAEPHGVARTIDPPAMDTNVASGGECRRIRARAHYPRVPKPFVDALAIQAPETLTATLCCPPRAVP